MVIPGFVPDAGRCIVTAEYAERRPGLAPSRKSRQNVIQAIAVEVDVDAGPPTSLALQAAQPGTRLTVTNAGTLQDRLLLKAAAVQVLPHKVQIPGESTSAD